MEIVAGVMSSLLLKLGALLTEEYKLQSGLKKSVQSLMDELASMDATLRDMAKQPPDKLSAQDKLWAGQVRELSYDAEDVVDTYMVVCVSPGYEHDAAQVSQFRKFREKVTALFHKGPTKSAKARHVAVASQNIKCLAKELCERRDRYNFTPVHQGPAAPTAMDPRLPALYKEAKDLVDIQDSANKLLALLFKEGDDYASENTTVVSIVGCGGIGKTTLAKKVHQECKEKYPFSFAFVFVSVSLNPDIKKLLESMLRQLDEKKYEYISEKAWDEKELIKELRLFLKDRRYFIVFDDIWDMKQWEIIKCTLANNDRENKIITTTRHKEVAEGIGGTYCIEPLSLESSKILFHKRIFHNQRECPLDLAELSDKILKKCGGIPLAIITIASLLASKKGRHEWERVYRTMGSGIKGTSPDVESMREILSLSYYNLELHLRRCLLYLSIFPEDFEIGRDRLIWRWIAEGFIGHENQEKQVLFDIGIEYFNKLINRCMIEPAHIDSQGSAEACRLHDMVLDLLNAISSEENFVAIVGAEKELTPGPNMRIRRLSIQNTTKKRQTAYLTKEMPHARSVTLFNPATKVMPSLSNFNVLRVLDLEDCDLRKTNHLQGVGSLLHLRYLGLRHTGIAELPRQVGYLQLLQTLDVRCSGYRFSDDHIMKELPSSIVNLRNLICLYVDEKTQLPKGMHNLTSLEQLSIVDVDNSPHFVKELGHLRELRVLDINWFWLDHGVIEEDLIMSLKSLHNIQSLSVSNTGHSCLDFFELEGWNICPGHLQRFRADSGFFTMLPEWISSPGFSNLSELSIVVAELFDVDFQVLGDLPVLCSLELELTGEDERMKVEEKITVKVGSTAFPCLRYFSFKEFDLGPMFPPKVMQRVERLDFSFRVREIIDANDDFDFGLENLLSLDHVSVELDNDDAKYKEVEAAEAALRGAINTHRKIPTLEIELCWPNSDEDDEEEMDG